MFKATTKTFLLGLSTLIPTAFTCWLIWFIAMTTDRMLKGLLLIFLPERLYWPGLGLIVAIAITYGIGVAMQATALPRLIKFFEGILFSIPLIKTIYGAFKDFSDFLSGQKKKKSSRMVMVRVPNSQHRMLGLVTHEHPEKELGTTGVDQLLVYFPMSYQIGGYTLMVDKNAAEPLTLPVEDAMRYILTAGISHAKR